MENKAALVTGASGGIGQAICTALADAGFDIGIHFRSNEDAAQKVLEKVEQAGRKGVLLQGDLSSSTDCLDVVTRCRQALGGLHTLVNNAGITRDTLLLRMDDEQFDEVIQANLYSYFYCTRAAMLIMSKARKGRIINISSVVGLTGNIGQANYAASKAAIVGFSKSCAKEMARRGVLVNVVAPGFIATEMTGALNDKAQEALIAQIPLKRAGTPSDVAHMVEFLASDRASYITGQVFVVDGGMVMA